VRALALLVAVAGIAGCAEPIDKLQPNRPPETLVTSGPPDSIDAVSACVHFQWTGEDPDGSIDHFEIILVDHPAAHDSITGDAINRVMVSVPRADDPRWTATVLVESTFVTLADTLRRDPHPGPGETPEDVRRQQLERWHTLFVRAVDDRGTPDHTPDYRSFNARTLAPIVELLPPVSPGRGYGTPPTGRLRWTGSDPLDEFESQAPDSCRWVLLPIRPGLYPWHSDYLDTLYSTPATSWSPWVAWDGDGGIGGVAEFQGLTPIRDGDPRYLFAVQAMDEAGAITAVFDWQTPHKNNTVTMAARNGLNPVLVLTEPHLGVFRFSDSGSAALDVVAGEGVRFSWLADASHYNGRIVDCRFGWNMLNPDDPSSWRSCNETSQLPEMRIEAGTQRLTVEVTADNGVRSSGTLILTAYPLTRQRAVLLIDNTIEVLPGSGQEQRDDERWFLVLSALAEQAGFDFVPHQDVHDVDVQRGFPPTRRLLDYAAVILHWDGVFPGLHGEPYNPYDARPRDTAMRSYLANGGRFWLTGFRPIRALWEAAIEPFNVTNREVPETPFPTDSLGVASLSYQIGVEMFAIGAGTGASRETYRHFCLGLRPAQPDAPVLVPGPNWTVGPNRPAVPNVEVYNMPAALSVQIPPLRPPPWRSLVAYSYISGVPEDAANGITFPLTADGQPVVILTKRRSTDALYTRAACGFDVMLLTEQSHMDLAEYILLEKFGLRTFTPDPRQAPRGE
jgi:hypothetical protein